DVAQALQRHFERACPAGTSIEFASRDDGNAAYLVPPDLPLLLAVEDAIEDALGARPVRVRVGSTLPLSDMIKRALGIDTVTLSFSTADEDFHSPNEFFRLSAIGDGLTAWTSLLRRLGRVTG
ncbi:MAG: M20/M25/M40 family metallo-hydrolase, partial [Pseudomonadota bacterium]